MNEPMGMGTKRCLSEFLPGSYLLYQERVLPYPIICSPFRRPESSDFVPMYPFPNLLAHIFQLLQYNNPSSPLADQQIPTWLCWDLTLAARLGLPEGEFNLDLEEDKLL